MSYRTGTTYYVGGRIPIKAYAKLKDFARSFEYDELTSNTGGGSLSMVGNFDRGRYEEFERWLMENKIAFRAHFSCFPGNFDAGIRYWNPEMDSVGETPANEDGEAVISLSRLEEAHKNNKTIEKVIAEMRIFTVPPFEIIEDKT